ncbi:DUF4465 domain-containing protein [uncultured Odoribacter sp.]|uniref:DUF4465 domain-containing protein n=1 Tax=uncultured Odoribacter sp. TaxID=876416 RepID=UPI002611F52E|nr:DUF4465 domain-containing protein [uncultured Odoribacter sp.]
MERFRFYLAALLFAGCAVFYSCSNSDNFSDVAPIGSGTRAEGTFICDFESAPDSVLVNSAYGTNLYDGTYTGYYDTATGLYMGLNVTGGYGYASGGFAISQFNDMVTVGYTNQCSVYYKDAITGKGGHNGSSTFAVAYGYYDDPVTSVSYDSRPKMYFKDGKEYTIQSAWVTNNTYAVLSMENGDSFAKKFSYENKDWYKLTITGYKADGVTVTGTVEVYLADFRKLRSPGILTEWQQVDLSVLKKVNKLVFNVSSSDAGQYGLNTPAYFCIDDITVTKD